MIEKASLPKILVYSTDLAPNLMLSESESEVVQSCPALRDPMDCSLPDEEIKEIYKQANNK